MQSYIQGTGTLVLYGNSSSSQGISLDTTGNVTLQANLDLQDNDKILLGTGDDLQIYHDGSNSYIKDAGTGQLILDGEAVILQYGAATKLATTSSGVTITGTATATSFSGDGSALSGVGGESDITSCLFS